MKSVAFLVVVSVALFISCKKDHQSKAAKKAIVTTIAGTGENGYLNGPALSAKFNHPVDVAVLRDGTIYVTDGVNRRIRKISGGQVTNFAGDGSLGIINGKGEAAQFKTPYLLAADAAGNAYVCDNQNPQVRKISPDANVTLYAGVSTGGYLDGPVATARFGQTYGILVDPQGNVIVVDEANNCIRKISLNGQVTTIAGNTGALGQGYLDGNAAFAKFQQILGIAMDNAGNIYIADFGNFRIRKLTPDGVVSTFAGSGIRGSADGPSGVAQFTYPGDMVIDKQQNLFITDEHSIRKITPQGEVSTLVGGVAGYADGDRTTAKFYYPTGIALDDAGNIYVADQINSRIRKISFQ